MLTCNGCIYRKGNSCAHHRISDMDPSRRCRFYRIASYKQIPILPLEEAFRLFKKAPPRPTKHAISRDQSLKLKGAALFLLALLLVLE